MAYFEKNRYDCHLNSKCRIEIIKISGGSNCARSSVDRVLASEAKGRAFDSRRACHKKYCGFFGKVLENAKKMWLKIYS